MNEIDSFSEKGEEDEGLISLLDSTEFELSGGQKKKVTVIQALLRKPTILLMDETFTGLDPHSLLLVQKALMEKLPKTMIICIDHKNKENNALEFYHYQMHFDNGRVKESKLT